MSVTLSPVAPRYAVSDADDPFKKYWWLILLGIAFTGIWLLAPMAGEKSIGSTSIDTSKPKIDPSNIEQAASGEGDGVYLSMDGTGHKRKEDPLFGSSLYQALPEDTTAAAEVASAAGAASAASASASGSTLAGALKKVSESGGWSEKAQKGFNVPKLSGTSLGGLGSAKGGSAGSSGFGSSNAKVGFANANGLSGGGGEAAGPGSKGIAALKAAAAMSLLASANKSNDGARSDSTRAFDGGGKGGSKVGGPAGGMPANYAALDAAPANLKLDDPKLNDKKIEAPPPADVGQSDMKGSDVGKQIIMAMAAAAVGAAIGGPVGGMAAQVMMQQIQRQADGEAKIREMEQKQEMDRATRRMGGTPSSPSGSPK